MKVTYQICFDVDVHKSFLVATIVKTTGGIEPPYQKKRFSTFSNSILAFKQWLLDNDCCDVCMESNDKHWSPVFNLLEDKINVVIANLKWVKAVKGNKDKRKDSKWIRDLFRLWLVKAVTFPARRFVSSENSPAIVTSLFPVVQAKRTGTRMLLLSVM